MIFRLSEKKVKLSFFIRAGNIIKFESIGHTFLLPDLFMPYNNSKHTIIILKNYSKGTK